MPKHQQVEGIGALTGPPTTHSMWTSRTSPRVGVTGWPSVPWCTTSSPRLSTMGSSAHRTGVRTSRWPSHPPSKCGCWHLAGVGQASGAGRSAPGPAASRLRGAGQAHCHSEAEPPLPQKAPVLSHPTHLLLSVPGARRNEGARGPPTSPGHGPPGGPVRIPSILRLPPSPSLSALSLSCFPPTITRASCSHGTPAGDSKRRLLARAPCPPSLYRCCQRLI